MANPEALVELPVPDVAMADATLIPEVRRVHGGAPPHEPVSGRISVGKPIVVPLIDAANEKPELKKVMDAFPDKRFYLVHLACTFQELEATPFETAWFCVNLENPAGGDDEVIAWSMQPQKSLDKQTVTEKAKLDSGLKLVPLTVSGGMEAQREYESAEVHLEALNELQANPIWQFSRTERLAIRGSHRFQLVVQAPAGAPCRGHVSLRVSLKLRKMLFWSYEAQVPDQAARTFDLK